MVKMCNVGIGFELCSLCVGDVDACIGDGFVFEMQQ